MSDELLDLVDSNDQVIGTVWKSQAHQNPQLIHREVAIAIFNHSGEVLLQQRSFTKSINPGLWTISAAGHLGAGEDSTHAISREVFEELGLKVKPIFVEKNFHTRNNRESRFVWIYYAIVSNHPKLILDSSEVAQTSWVRISDLKKFTQTNNFPQNSTSFTIISQIVKSLKL